MQIHESKTDEQGEGDKEPRQGGNLRGSQTDNIEKGTERREETESRGVGGG